MMIISLPFADLRIERPNGNGSGSDVVRLDRADWQSAEDDDHFRAGQLIRSFESARFSGLNTHTHTLSLCLCLCLCLSLLLLLPCSLLLCFSSSFPLPLSLSLSLSGGWLKIARRRIFWQLSVSTFLAETGDTHAGAAAN